MKIGIKIDLQFCFTFLALLPALDMNANVRVWDENSPFSDDS